MWKKGIIIFFIAAMNLQGIGQFSTLENTIPLPLFSKNNVINISFHADFKKILNDRGEEPRYHDALLYFPKNGDTLTFNIKLKVRGNFRKNPETCGFPPLRVKFTDKNQLENTIFQGQKKLKLVTHCNKEEELLQEYLLYKVYQLFTQKSFRVRLIRATYQDKNQFFEPFTRFAFFIEDDDDMAERNGGKSEDIEDFERREAVAMIDSQHVRLIHIFQYMIGNTDWNIERGKNFKYIYYKDNDMIIPVPYDFDLSGIIDVTYPNIESVFGSGGYNHRQYKNICSTKNEIQKLLKTFRKNRKHIKKTYRDFPFLSEKKKNEIWKYYRKFYFKSRWKSKKIFTGGCKNR